ETNNAGAAGAGGSINLATSGSGIVVSPTAQTSTAGNIATYSLSTVAVAADDNSSFASSSLVWSAPTLPAGFSVSSAGVISVSSLSPPAAATYSLQVWARTNAGTAPIRGVGQYWTMVTVPWTITAGAASQLTFTAQPNGGNSGAVWTAQPAVLVQDSFGNQLSTGGTPVTLTLTSGAAAGSLSCTTNPLSTTSGLAAFAGCKVDGGVRSYTLVASSPGLTSATSDPFSITRGTNRAPTATAPSGPAVEPGQTVRLVVTVTDPDGFTANSSGDEGTPTVTATTPLVATAAVGSVSCAGFTADAGGATSGTVNCDYAVPTSAPLGGYSWSFTVTDSHSGVSASYPVTGTIGARSATGAVVCKDGPSGSVVSTVETGVPSWCTVTYTDASTVGGSVIADSPQALTGTVSEGPLTGADFFAPDGSISSSNSCTLASGATGVSSCDLGPVIFRSAGSQDLAPAPVSDAIHGASSAPGSLSVTASCTQRVYDGKTLSAPAGTYANNSQFDFYGYNLGCGSPTPTKFGYALDVGSDPDLGGADGYFASEVADIGSDGFAQWHPQV
ncbi:MAG TPA: hypothetical protein VGM93_15365, partial [Acidimicrobiales bacterium]